MELLGEYLTSVQLQTTKLKQEVLSDKDTYSLFNNDFGDRILLISQQISCPEIR